MRRHGYGSPREGSLLDMTKRGGREAKSKTDVRRGDGSERGGRAGERKHVPSVNKEVRRSPPRVK